MVIYTGIMKIIITILVLAGLSYFVFFHGNASKTESQNYDTEQASGIITDRYNTLQGGVDDVQAVKDLLEQRNKIPNE